MSSLRDRMNLLRGRASEGRDTKREQAEVLQEARESETTGVEEDGLAPVWAKLGVKLAESSRGTFLLRTVRYPFTHGHGIHQLGELPEAASWLKSISSRFAGELTESRILFLDLETTGLGVGTGNVPFMTGFGYVDGNEFVVEQALIRHPAEEAAMLAYLAERLKDRPYLATYNGKTFDWPVLAGRFIMNGFRSLAYEPAHLDFLHPSRSIWRNTLTSCRLSHVEEERLGIKRVNDVPGSMAPAIYFQFLSDGDPMPLEGVFAHNELDILTLACLAVRFGRLLGGGLGSSLAYPEESEELLRTGLWLERMEAVEQAECLYSLLESREPASSWSLPLAARDKKRGNWPRAVLLWQKAAEAAERSQLPVCEAHIELSMYYEHREKRMEPALAYAERAFELLQRRLEYARTEASTRQEAEALRKRIERLRRKQMGRGTK